MYGSPQIAPSRGGTYYLGAPLSQRPVRRRRLSSFGALTPDQATEQIFPTAQVKTSAGHNQATRAVILASAQAGQLVDAAGSPAYIPGTKECAATGQSTNVRLAQVSGTMAITGLNAAAMASASIDAAIGSILGPATFGISALIGLFPLLFGHHAQAVKKEQSVLCAAVPAANNYLQIIDQAVQSGQFTPQQGIAGLNSLLSDFRSQVASIVHGSDPMSSGECNAACVMISELRAIVLVKTSQYQDLQATAAANPVAAVQSSLIAPIQQTLQSAGLPSWLLPAAAFFVLWEVV